MAGGEAVVNALTPIHGPEWHATRLRHVGGSEISALWGMQPAYALSHFALWQVKSGRVPAPEVNNPRTRWGLRLEEAIAEAVAEEKGWTVTKGGYVSDPTTPGLGCTLDYIASDAEGFDGPGALELKNSDWLQHKRSWVDGEPPLHILLQLQLQIACTGYKWGAVACLIGGNQLEVYPYVARPKLIAEIRRRVTAFWQSIEKGQEPDVDGSDSAAYAIRALHPEMTDELVDMSADAEIADICAGCLEAAEERLAAAKREAEFKNRLAAKIGPHARVKAPGYWINTSVIAPSTYTVSRKESRRTSIKQQEVAA